MKKNGGSLDVQSFCVCYSSQFSLLLMMRFPPLHTPPFNHTHSTIHLHSITHTPQYTNPSLPHIILFRANSPALFNLFHSLFS